MELINAMLREMFVPHSMNYCNRFYIKLTPYKLDVIGIVNMIHVLVADENTRRINS